MASSFLYSIPLRGIGSADVESLPSYLFRQSAALGVSVNRVIEYAFLWKQKDEPSESTVCLSRRSDVLNHLVRPNATTDAVVRALSAATLRPELRSSTFLALSHAMDRCVNVFDSALRWCPACIEEFHNVGDSGYFKLQWQLTSVTVCSVHGTSLISRCPHCNKSQSSVDVHRDCVSCVWCERQLFTQEQKLTPPGDWRVKSADLLALVQEIASDPELLFPSDGLRHALAELFERAWEQTDELAFWKIVPRNESLGIVDRTIPVTMSIVRKYAYMLGMSIPELLSGAIATTTNNLDPSWTSSLPDSLRMKRRRAHRDRAKLSIAMEAALRLAQAGTPVSLKSIAKANQVSVGCLRYHFPTQSHDVVAAFEHWRKSEQSRKLLEACAAIAAYVASADWSKATSKKGILRELRRTTNLPKEVLRKEIERFLDQALPRIR